MSVASKTLMQAKEGLNTYAFFNGRKYGAIPCQKEDLDSTNKDLYKQVF